MTEWHIDKSIGEGREENMPVCGWYEGAYAWKNLGQETELLKS